MPPDFGLRKLSNSVCEVGPGEIFEKDDDLLHAALDGARFAHDQRRGEQVLLLQAEMRMHPACARRHGREFVVSGLAWLDQRPGNIGDAILTPGCVEAVPVEARRHR